MISSGSHADRSLLVFSGEKELICAMYDQIGKKEQVLSPPYTCTPLDASLRERKKRKQSEDNAPGGRLCSMAPYCALWCMIRLFGGLMIRQGHASNGLYFHW